MTDGTCLTSIRSQSYNWPMRREAPRTASNERLTEGIQEGEVEDIIRSLRGGFLSQASSIFQSKLEDNPL